VSSSGTGGPRVSAVIAAYNRRHELERVLDELATIPAVGEVVVADNGSTDGTLELLRSRRDVVLLELGANLGVAARNRAAEAAGCEFLLLLDDDSFPRPDAVEHLIAILDAEPSVAVVGGFVQDVDSDGQVLRDRGPGTFDWLLRGGRAVPASGVPAYFFPECAALARRDAYLEVGGYFEPYFHSGTLGLDLTTMLLSRGWEVRYAPVASFAHLKAATRPTQQSMTRLRVRNEMWYFARHFPWPAAVARMLFYAVFNLVLASYLRHPGAVVAGVVDAWRGRRDILATRAVLPRDTLRRAELNRGRMHLRLLAAQLGRRLRGDRSSTLRGRTGSEFGLSGRGRALRGQPHAAVAPGDQDVPPAATTDGS
jgi:GT2 family glycosyltransferase